MILSNQIRFDFQKYGEESIIKESYMNVSYLGDWHHRQNFELSKTELTLQDLAISLDDITSINDDSLFRLKESKSIPFR